MLSASEMKELIAEVVVLRNALGAQEEMDEVAAAGPAPPKALVDRLVKHFKGKLPPSYVQLLSLHDGVANLEWVDVSILTIAERIEGKLRDDEESWVDADRYKAGELLIFAQSESDSHVVAFLQKHVDASGEMKVVHFDAEGDSGAYDNLEAYLRARRDWYRKYLKPKKATKAKTTAKTKTKAKTTAKTKTKAKTTR